MSELYLIVTIDGRRVAIRAAEVHSVIELDAITAIPQAPAFVAGLAALRSRALTVIDCRLSLEITDEMPASPTRTAIVIGQDEFLYALLVDGHEDVAHPRSDPAPVPGDLGSGWSRVAEGLIETDMGTALLVDVNGLISGPAAKEAA